jgi:hypothetical protein
MAAAMEGWIQRWQQAAAARAQAAAAMGKMGDEQWRERDGIRIGWGPATSP